MSMRVYEVMKWLSDNPGKWTKNQNPNAIYPELVKAGVYATSTRNADVSYSSIKSCMDTMSYILKGYVKR